METGGFFVRIGDGDLGDGGGKEGEALNRSHFGCSMVAAAAWLKA